MQITRMGASDRRGSLRHTGRMELSEILDTILQYLKVLAWPLIVLVLALVFRGPVVALLQRVKKYSAWGQTVELGEEARELKHDSDAVAEVVTSEATKPASAGDQQPVESAGDASANGKAAAGAQLAPTGTAAQDAVSSLNRLKLFYRLADIDPTDFPTGARRAVARAWKSLSERVDELALLLNLPWSGSKLNDVAIALVNRGLLNKNSALIAFRLTGLHNDLTRVSDADLNVQLVQDFMKSAQNLERIFVRVRDDVSLNGTAHGGSDA